MMINRIFTGLGMVFKMLFRRRIIILSLAVLPVVFLSVVQLTASDRIIPFRLASLDENIFLEEVQRGVSLVFFSVTSAGFLVSLLALSLIQIDREVNRRLVICGYHPFELLISNLLFLLIMIIAIATYLGLLTHSFYRVDHLLPYISGLMLIGIVYGCYGLMVGSLVDGKLEGIFMIVLLANIDVGWLQNPTYYAEAHNNVIIRYLPGYYPSQAAIIGAFTDYPAGNPRIFSLLYGSVFLIFSLLIFYNRMRKRK